MVPKGIGRLYVRRRNPEFSYPRSYMEEDMNEECALVRFIRPQIVGFAKAEELGLEEQPVESERLTQLRQRSVASLSQLEGLLSQRSSHSTTVRKPQHQV
jgi:cysteine desulfurase